MSYIDVLKHKKTVGEKVAIIGAGGIGFDVAEYLTHEGKPTSLDVSAFLKEWGIDGLNEVRGGVEGVEPVEMPNPRKVFLLQRKETKLGASLGKTTGWIHRTSLKNKNVEMLRGVAYRKIDDEGLHITRNGKDEVLTVDNVVVCAGQRSKNDLFEPLKQLGVSVHLVGGAFKAAELDAKEAINQASRLAADL